LSTWGEQYIYLEDKAALQRRTRKRRFPKEFRDVCLWFDSSDFRLTGKISTSTKSSWWSYKLNSPGLRYNALTNAKGQVNCLFGPYSPKIYDGDFLLMHQDFFESQLSNFVLIGDNHYKYGRENFSNVKIHAPYTNKRKRSEDVEGETLLTNSQQKYNRELAQVRSRVELVFASIKNKFYSLNSPFKLSLQQHKYLMKYAVAIHNRLCE